MKALGPAYFLTRATQCRRLAKSVSWQADPVIKNLIRLAEEFEAKAIECDPAILPLDNQQPLR
jgi:hypothetical protein